MQVQKESQSSSRAQCSDRKKRRRKKKKSKNDISLFIITEKKSLYIPFIPELYINKVGNNQQDSFMLYIIKVCVESWSIQCFIPLCLETFRGA